MLLDAGHPKEAAASYRSVLLIRPGSRVAELGLGRALAAGPPDAEAESWISRLEGRYPADPAPLVLRGVLFERRGDAEAAARAYRDALSLDPGDADARRGLARLSGPTARQ
jgi:Flp pilus assembly protein TadD